MSENQEYAIIRVSGRQYRCSPGQKLTVDRVAADPGDSLPVEEVLMINSGGALKVGTPLVSGAAVTLKVLEHRKDKKVVTFKKIRRAGYTKKQGHRQERTMVLVEKISS